MKLLPNKSLHTNHRPAFRGRARRFIGRWIRCQRPLPAAVGELRRSRLDTEFPSGKMLRNERSK